MKVAYCSPDASGIVAWPRLDSSVRSIVTVGTFDGVHRGHQALLKRTVDLARSYSARSVVILFDPRPGFVHQWAHSHHGHDPASTDRDPWVLSSLRERLDYIAEAGIDITLVVRYTMAFSQLSFTTFLGQLISQRLELTPQPSHTLGLHTFVLGKGAAIGRGRKGTAAAITRIAEAFRFFQVDVVDDHGPGWVNIAPLDGTGKERKVRVWSSSHVRSLVMAGQTDQAQEILGHPYALEGEIIHGDEQGRKLGYPTANLGSAVSGVIPADGVYAGWIADEGPEGDMHCKVTDFALTPATSAVGGHDYTPTHIVRRWPAAISVGSKPTFNGQHRIVEAYAINAGNDLDLYGHRMRFEFSQRVGGMHTFTSTDELIAYMRQMVHECEQTDADGWTDSLTGSQYGQQRQ